MKTRGKISYSGQKSCVVCGKKIEITHYTNKTYNGGHYFGKVPLISKKEMRRVCQAGTRKSRIGKLIIDVLKKEPRPYSYAEHWECQKCYES